MIQRILTLILLIAAGAWVGAKIGQFISYWFAPDIMRLYLNAGEYWQRLPALLLRDDPLGLSPIVIRCSFAGSLLGSAIMLIPYYYLNRHRKKP